MEENEDEDTKSLVLTNVSRSVNVETEFSDYTLIILILFFTHNMARAVILFDDIVMRVAETGYRVLTFSLHLRVGCFT